MEVTGVCKLAVDFVTYILHEEYISACKIIIGISYLCCCTYTTSLLSVFQEPLISCSMISCGKAFRQTSNWMKTLCAKNLLNPSSFNNPEHELVKIFPFCTVNGRGTVYQIWHQQIPIFNVRYGTCCNEVLSIHAMTIKNQLSFDKTFIHYILFRINQSFEELLFLYLKSFSSYFWISTIEFFFLWHVLFHAHIIIKCKIKNYLLFFRRIQLNSICCTRYDILQWVWSFVLGLSGLFGAHV